MIISSLCPPTLVYIGFSLVQIIIDLYNGIFNQAILKFVIMIIFTLIINILCDLGYTVIAWILVFVPIIMMTIVSTLLLKVFGLSPDEKEIKSKIVDLSNNNESNEFSGTELLNQQKFAFFYDKFNSVNRIDRDSTRRKMYKDLKEKIPDLSTNDLSNNIGSYVFIKSYLNDVGDIIFNYNNSRLMELIGSGYSNHEIGDSIKNINNNNIVFGGGNSILSPFYANYRDLNNTSLSDVKARFNSRKSSYVDTESSGNTYSSQYHDEYKLNGYLLFYRSKYNGVKNNLIISNPNVTDVEIDKKIQEEWDKLSSTDQTAWNDSKDANSGSTSTSSSSSETSSNTNNLEPCFPGKDRNSLGVCLNPCSDYRYERLTPKGDCKLKLQYQ